jgi:hypothetical protein
MRCPADIRQVVQCNGGKTVEPRGEEWGGTEYWKTYFCRIAGCSMSFLPKTMRWLHHLRHSSTMMRENRVTPQDIMNRSWLKFDTVTRGVLASNRPLRPEETGQKGMSDWNLLITMNPLCSWPSRFSTGTLTLLYSTNAVPAVVEYDVLISFVSTFSSLGTRMTENPLSVLQPVTK